MKAMVVFSSQTGNSYKLAKAFWEGLTAEKKQIFSIDAVPDPELYDLVAVSFWLKGGQPDPKAQMKWVGLTGDVADPANRPPGCPFHPRCPHAVGLCKTEEPSLRNAAGAGGQSHQVACHLADDLSLLGIQG